ncbi:MAG: pitrilysin family protein [Desulfatiglans sp.]|jgi:predicted Zn-dependent peptidase|nr:pitrilysin family protein [Desulfatiglans sp.]
MYSKTVLENGVRIISEQMDHLKSISVGLWVDTGSRDEAGSENGISHFIEHMIFKGTRNRSSLQIAKELDAIGGMSNAFTGKDNTCFYARVLGKHFPLVSEILSDIFLNSLFDHEDLERERLVILQEVSMVEDTPDENIHVLFNRLFWPNHPIGMPILGTVETVSSITKGTIQKYIKDFYVPERIVIAAAGNVDHESIVSKFAPQFESLERGRNHYVRKAPESFADALFHHKDLEQVHVCLGGDAPSQTSDKRFASAIFNTVLGGNMSSRLFQEIREKRGLAYSVYSFLSTYVDTGFLGVYAAVDRINVEATIETIQREIKKLAQGELSESDLWAAKEHLTGGLYLTSEGADSQMMRTAKNELVFERHIPVEEVISNLEKVTRDEVVEVANSIFLYGKVSLATLGPLREEDFNKECFGF